MELIKKPFTIGSIINFASEEVDLQIPKVICSICRARLTNLETGKIDHGEMERRSHKCRDSAYY